VFVFEDPPIPLLPQVPYNVNEDSIEPPSILLWHLACCLLPPFGNACGVLLWELDAKVFLGQHLVPNGSCERP
jgi:hypothetical protein